MYDVVTLINGEKLMGLFSVNQLPKKGDEVFIKGNSYTVVSVTWNTTEQIIYIKLK